MFKIIYNSKIIEKNLFEEVVETVEQLNNGSVIQEQMVLVEKEDHQTLEIAVAMNGKSILFYTPSTDEADMKISCNETVDRAKSDDILIKAFDGETEKFSASNIVDFEIALKVLKAFLCDEDFLLIGDWYSY